MSSQNGGMLAQYFPLIAIMSTIRCVLAFAADASEPSRTEGLCKRR
jgi:hypothetical protein